jgi:hypothetical protein
MSALLHKSHTTELRPDTIGQWTLWLVTRMSWWDGAAVVPPGLVVSRGRSRSRCPAEGGVFNDLWPHLDPIRHRTAQRV